MSDLVLQRHTQKTPLRIKVSSIPFSIGRALANDFVLDHPQISPHHALIDRTESGLVLRDLGSSNGVWVDGRKIFEHRLGQSQKARLGDVDFDFVIDPTLARARGKRRSQPQRRSFRSSWPMTGLATFAAMLASQCLLSGQWPQKLSELQWSQALAMALAILTASWASMTLGHRRRRRQNFQNVALCLSALSAALLLWPSIHVQEANLPLVKMPIHQFMAEIFLAAIGLWSTARLISLAFAAWPRQKRLFLAAAVVTSCLGTLHFYTFEKLAARSRHLYATISDWLLAVDVMPFSHEAEAIAQQVHQLIDR